MSDREIMDAKNGVTSKRVEFRDPIVENVCDKFIRRSDVGYEKYGRTLHAERTGNTRRVNGRYTIYSNSS